jgi:subtilisin family serine protease
MTSQQLAARLASESDVEYAVPDLRRHRMAVPNDPLYLSGPPISGTTGGPAAGQWYLRPPTAELRSAINAETAWNYTVGSPSVVVAVIDTGVRFDHPDLKRVANGGNLLPGYDFVSDAKSPTTVTDATPIRPIPATGSLARSSDSPGARSRIARTRPRTARGTARRRRA